MAEFNPSKDQSSSFPSTDELPDGESLHEAFSLLTTDINMLQEKTTALETEYHERQESSIKNRLRPRPDESTRDDKSEYFKTLQAKGELVMGLAEVLKTTDFCPNVPKTKIQAYHQMVELVSQKCQNINKDIEIQLGELKKQDEEFDRLKSEYETFLRIKNREENVDEENVDEENEIELKFQEAQSDLMKVLSVLYPEKIKDEFIQVMAQLTEAYVNNLDNEEEQFVEIPLQILKNPGLRCLLTGCVIIQHPTALNKIRLSGEE